MSFVPQNTHLGNLVIQEVLEYYDFPRLFICSNNTGQFYIALSTYDDDDEYHWLYLPASSFRLDAISKGIISLHDAFRTPENGFLISVKNNADLPAKIEYILAEQVSDVDLPSHDYKVLISTEFGESQGHIPPSQVAQSARREIFDYHIYPGERREHEIPSRKLGAILTSTQELIDALGQATTGHPSVRGPLPGELLQKTKVNVARVFQASFGVQFRSAMYSDLLNSSTVSNALAEFTNLLSAADSEDLLSNKLHHLKGRVASKYRRLLKELTDINSGLIVDWGSVESSKGGQFSLSYDQVKKAYEIVDRIDIEMADELLIRGRLVGFNSRTQRYEIKSTEDGKTYAGKVSNDAKIEVINPAIGEIYESHLRMLVETQSTSGDELIRWVLVMLK